MWRLLNTIKTQNVISYNYNCGALITIILRRGVRGNFPYFPPLTPSLILPLYLQLKLIWCHVPFSHSSKWYFEFMCEHVPII